MPWFKVDDSLADHPDIIALLETKAGREGLGLWTIAGSWCARHLTDGLLPASLPRRIGFTKKHADALVKAGLWEVTDDGYRFRNWLKYQPSREQVTAQRAVTKRRVERHRNGVTNAPATPLRTPSPARPGPTRPDPKKEKCAPSGGAPPATPPPSPVFETAEGPLEIPPPEVPHSPPISPETARPMLDRIRKRFGERYARATARTAHDRSKRSCEAFEKLAEFAIDARFTDEQLDDWIGWYFAQPEAKAAEYHATHFRQWMSECAERKPLRAKRGVRKTGMAQVGRPEDFDDDEPDWLKPPAGAHT